MSVCPSRLDSLVAYLVLRSSLRAFERGTSPGDRGRLQKLRLFLEGESDRDLLRLKELES